MNEREDKGLRLPARAALVYLISGAIAKGIGILFTPIFTRIMTPAEYGGYAYYMSLVGFGTLLSSAAYSQSVSYGGAARFGAYDFYPTLFGVSLGAAFLISLPTVIFSGISPTLGAALLLQMLADAAVGAYAMRSRYLYDYKKVALISAFSSLFSPLIAILFLHSGAYAVGARVGALLSVSLVTAAVAVAALIRSPARISDRERLTFALHTAIPFLPVALASALSAEADKLIVGRILGGEALAKYSVAYSIGAGLHFISTSLSSALCPWIVRRVRCGEARLTKEPTGAVITLLFSFSLGIILIAPEVLGILAPKSYLGAINTVIPVALGVPVSFASGVCTLLLTESGMSKEAALFSGTGGVVGAILSLPLTLIFGLSGAAYGGYIGILISHFLLLRSLKRAAIPSPFKGSELLISILFYNALAFLFSLFFPYTLLRAVLLLFPIFTGAFSLKRSYALLFEKKKSPNS